MTSHAPLPDAAPSWETIDGSSAVQFFAIPLKMQTLTIGIVAIIVTGGAGLATALIVGDAVFGIRSGSRAIVLLGGCLALPAALIYIQVLRRRTVKCLLVFDRNGVSAEIGNESIRILFRDLDRFIWRQNTDYARVVMSGSTNTISLISGLVKKNGSLLPQLPCLPPHVVRLLVGAGLTERRSNRNGNGLVTFARHRR